MSIRCRNCGLLHQTQHCPNYGPAFPEPGKTFEDYLELYEKIQNLVARDIIAEHDEMHGNTEEDPEPELAPKRVRSKKKKVDPAPSLPLG